EAIKRAFGKLQRLHIAGPGPIGHDRAIDVDNVGKVAGHGSGDNGIVVGGLRKLLQYDLPIGLGCVEVINDADQDFTLNRVAGAVVPKAQFRLSHGGGAHGGRYRKAGCQNAQGCHVSFLRECKLVTLSSRVWTLPRQATGAETSSRFGSLGLVAPLIRRSSLSAALAPIAAYGSSALVRPG